MKSARSYFLGSEDGANQNSLSFQIDLEFKGRIPGSWHGIASSQRSPLAANTRRNAHCTVLDYRFRSSKGGRAQPRND